MKKLLALMLSIMMIFALAACGGEEAADKNVADKKADAENPFVGNWIGVGGEIFDIGMDPETAADYNVVINKDGTADLITEGEGMDATWESKDDKITFTIEFLDIVFDGVLKDDVLTIDDYCGFGVKLICAQEGSDAADPSLYIPEEAKAMVGTWVSNEVKDILEEDLSDVIPADALVMEFRSDFTVDITFNGETIAGEKWTIYDGYGYLEDSNYDISWDVLDGEIKVSFWDDEEFYYFICAKA